MSKIVGVINVQGKRRDIDKVIARAVAMMNGSAPAGQLGRALWVRVGFQALSLIKASFLEKSLGGTDEAGESWKPLAKSTVAYSRRHRKLPGDPKMSPVFSRAKNLRWIPRSSKRAAFAPSYALTEKQRTRWWQDYARLLAQYKGDKGHAAATAWILAKGRGATTLMEQFGNMKPPILRDTFLLYNSLSPGAAGATGKPEKVKGQVFRVEAGKVIVGTNVPYAKFHHEGTKRCPQRRLWPAPRKWPSSWWGQLLNQARGGLIEVVIQLLTRG